MPSRTEVIAELSRRWQADDRVGVEELVHPDVEIDMTIRVMNP